MLVTAKVETAERGAAMGWYRIVSMIIVSLCMAGCSSDPNAPVNQMFPIRQMDHFFRSLSGPPTPAAAPASPDYARKPGYAPAYPPY
ncbi:MAG: hypothetical protein QOF70_3867 [Acetobacteraceae bacterium]|jgi:hypothetical protein|nr:hypothetical protein [Acetobacteraceae bacterium]